MTIGNRVLPAIGKHGVYAGKRVKRGLLRASDGRTVNADINGALNIARKAVPDAFADGIEGFPCLASVERSQKVMCIVVYVVTVTGS